MLTYFSISVNSRCSVFLFVAPMTVHTQLVRAALQAGEAAADAVPLIARPVLSALGFSPPEVRQIQKSLTGSQDIIRGNLATSSDTCVFYYTMSGTSCLVLTLLQGSE